MDEMIASCRFLEWVNEIVQIRNDEETEKAQWEFFLHKVFDKTFDEFMEECNMIQRRQIADVEFNFEATFEGSKNMLEGFMPE